MRRLYLEIILQRALRMSLLGKLYYKAVDKNCCF